MFNATYAPLQLTIRFCLAKTIKCIKVKKIKKDSSPSTRHGGAWGERRYSSYSFTTSALEGSEWSASRPGRDLPPGKGHPVPTVHED
jgi:hypothetical protein